MLTARSKGIACHCLPFQTRELCHDLPLSISTDCYFLCAGRYLATAAADKQLVVWDVAKKEPEVVTKHSVPAQVAAIQWHPDANELAATLLNNNLLSWQGVVPTHLLEPHVPVPDVASMPGAVFRSCPGKGSAALL